ncbi:GNAT family protein [Nemorincola caseinilytica]|uniref:GNAT family protein n=1 Tax=Nemorincola caseinilytica TaxID=2054315 RepID=A0ABP8N9T4_9BACT
MLTVNFTPFPELVTERLVLRRVTHADAPEILFIRSDAQMMEYVKRPICANMDEAIAFIDRVDGTIDSNDCISWGICLREDRTKMIGTTAIWRLMKEHYRGELGYALMTQYQGRGLMQEALTAVLNYGFGTMGLHTIEANIDPGNTASQRVLERCGFVQEGYQRENYFYEGVFYDTACFAILTPLKG